MKARTPKIDICGQKFGKLKAMRRHSQNERGIWFWECRCDCGQVKIVRQNALRGGSSKSCGCERFKFSNEPIHGASRRGKMLPEYRAWKAMRYRCSSKIPSVFKHYGARGITVCKRWDSFESFLEDMGKKPNPESSVDRKNNDNGYEPDNCRWATRSEQMKNRRPCPERTRNKLGHFE